MAGVASAIMEGADLDDFARVSAERVGKNLPLHIPQDSNTSDSTSLASSLLNDKA